MQNDYSNIVALEIKEEPLIVYAFYTHLLNYLFKKNVAFVDNEQELDSVSYKTLKTLYINTIESKSKHNQIYI